MATGTGAATGTRIADEIIAAALQRIDAHPDSAAISRRGPVVSYRCPGLSLEIRNANGEPSAHSVHSRAIAARDIWFLSSHFLYTGTAGVIALPTRAVGTIRASGIVCGVRYIQGTGSIYDVQMRFDAPICLALFSSTVHAAHVLAVDDSPLEQKLIARLLEAHNVEVCFVVEEGAAIAKAGTQGFDLLLVSLDLATGGGAGLIAELRRRCYAGPIVAIGSARGPQEVAALLAAGCTEFLPRPFAPEQFVRLVNRHRPEPVISRHAGDESLRGLVDQFVRELPGRAQEIALVLERHEATAVERLARKLRTSAVLYGLDAVVEAAANVEDAVRRGMPLEEMRPALTALVRVCDAARPVLDETC